MTSKLFNIRCDNCGAEYRISSRGEMNCPFCGSKIYLNDKDFEEYKKTRDEMLIKDKVENDLVNSDGDVLHKWDYELMLMLYSSNDKPINIRYHYKFDGKDKTTYIGRNRVILIYKDSSVVDKVMANIQSLEYPSADIKGLSSFFPSISMVIPLKDGRCLVSMDKPENVYPLMFFEKLDPKQVAWMISRMENFGCLFEYNSVDFSELDKSFLYINPKTHQMYLLDGWEFMQPKGTSNNYLHRVRTVAKDLMYLDRAPQKCIDFLNSEPEQDAYTDFQAWDDVIEHGFSGHNFHQFTEN